MKVDQRIKELEKDYLIRYDTLLKNRNEFLHKLKIWFSSILGVVGVLICSKVVSNFSMRRREINTDI